MSYNFPSEDYTLDLDEIPEREITDAVSILVDKAIEDGYFLGKVILTPSLTALDAFCGLRLVSKVMQLREVLTSCMIEKSIEKE